MVGLDPAVGVLCRNGKPIYYAYIKGVYRESPDATVINGAVRFAKAHGAGLHLDRRYFCGFPYNPPAVGTAAYRKLPRVRLIQDWATYAKDTVFVLIEVMHCGPRNVTDDDGTVRTIHPTNCRVMLEGEALPAVDEGTVVCKTVPGEITVQADDVMTAVRIEQAKAEKEARGEGYRFVRSRGRHFCSIGVGGVCPPFEPGEDIRWNGTLRSVKDVVAEVLAKYPRITEISINGGFDGSDDFGFEDYSPWIACWNVVVWRRTTGYLYRCLY